MTDKTKAAMPGRQCYYTKLVRGQNTTLIDQVNRRYFCSCAGGVLTQPLAEFILMRKFSAGVSGIGVYPIDYYSTKFFAQPFGSMPRCCNSLRMMRFIQADTDASPSWAKAFLIPSSKPGSTRNAICLLPLPLISMVDIWLTPDYFKMVIKCMTGAYQKATPRTVGAVPRRLTKPLYEVTIMADIQSTQTHLEFTWRFFALARAELDGEIYRLSVDATTEQEARRVLAPHFILSLAARLPVRGHHV